MKSIICFLTVILGQVMPILVYYLDSVIKIVIGSNEFVINKYYLIYYICFLVN